MNGEVENNNENKKKQKVALLIGVVTLLIAVLGATYAYFQISTDNESSNTNITGSTPLKSFVTLKQGTSKLHLNISASDMSYENRTKEYYGTDGEDPYVGTEELGTKTIASVELSGGETTTKYSCTAKLTVSKVIEPDADKDTMIEVLQPGDMILQFKGNIISEKLDLSELKENNPKEYDLSFKVTGNNPEVIQAYIKLVNKDEPQNYLAGSKLNIDINTSDLKCNVYIEHPNLTYLREKDKENNISNGLLYELYRYQGNSVVNNIMKDEDGNITSIDRTDTVNNNYICLGNNCSEDSDDMYRIIGINEEGEIKVIKNTPYANLDWWEEGYEMEGWQEENLFFLKDLNNNFLSYLPEDLIFKIKDTIWKNTIFYDYYEQSYINSIDSAATDDDKRKILSEQLNLAVEEHLKAISDVNEEVQGKICLMSIIDYCKSFENNGIVNCKTSLYADEFENPSNKDYGFSWLSIKNYNTNEWTMSVGPYGEWNGLESISKLGNITDRYNDQFLTRPVFYLSSDVKLSGEGTIDSPFTIGIEGTYSGPKYQSN